ncbi:MAG: hypothetical protein NTV81_02295 [Candidatus Komeilibacteria bacterium]|nr:hypothetical protein [Candidatus Komeilibacteria bacterium]
MKHSKSNKKKSSSKLLNNFLGKTSAYAALLKRQQNYLTKKYPNQHLSKVFATLPLKLLTIGPMALCDYLTADLRCPCPPEVLTAIGLTCLQISAHDDAVDETPGQQADLAALIYAGNLAALEGIQLLIKNRRLQLADLISSLVNQNHYWQQWRVEKTWDKKPKNFLAYQDGVRDGVVLMEIGLYPALVLAKQPALKPQIAKFAKSYALILQLIDDIREADQDEKLGYHSFPILEGYPYKKSWQIIDQQIRLSQTFLKPTWPKMNSLVINLKKLTAVLKKDYELSA